MLLFSAKNVIYARPPTNEDVGVLLGSIATIAPSKVDHSSWGELAINNGYTNYVAEDGTTSAEVDKKGVIWLKEESDGTSAWYGLDNSSGEFELGSKFWVRWLNKVEHPEDFKKYYDLIDPEIRDNENVWVFLTGVKSPDGVEYENLSTSIPYYIQLGSDWDAEDVQAWYISEGQDESLEVSVGTDSELSDAYHIQFPQSTSSTKRSYARTMVKHFSPYVIFDKWNFEDNKVNLESISNRTTSVAYNGSQQEVNDFKFYENKGTIYYKLGNNGEWKEGIPTVKDVGNYYIYYYVKGNEYYNDLGSAQEPLIFNFKIIVDKSGWGREVNNNGYINYVDEDGMTSAEVDKKGIIWLKEESDGASAWYGLDNSSGKFALGSRFYVQWLSQDDPLFNKYYNLIDPQQIVQSEDGKLWIFLTGVISPDGEEYKDLGETIPYYIQLGSDWDENDVKAYYISQGIDESVGVSVGTAETLGIDAPDPSSKYAKLMLKHFSPYYIYDKYNNNDYLSDYGLYNDNSKSAGITGSSASTGVTDSSTSTGVTDSSVKTTQTSGTNALKSINTGDNMDFSYLIMLFIISSILPVMKLIKVVKSNRSEE